MTSIRLFEALIYQIGFHVGAILKKKEGMNQ